MWAACCTVVESARRPQSAARPASANRYQSQRMRSSYVAFKTAIMNEIVQKQLYEGHQLRQLFRSALELGREVMSGRCGSPTVCSLSNGLRSSLHPAPQKSGTCIACGTT